MPQTAKAPSTPPATPSRLPRLIIAGLAVVLIAVMIWWFFGRQERRDAELFTGYVVSQDVYMASPVSGTLAAISVQRGQRVEAGTPLFRIDPTVRAAEADQARAQISADLARVQQHEADLARARADVATAEAEVDRARAQVVRLTSSHADKPGSVAQLDIDQAQAALRAAQRKRDAAATQVASATAAISAARAQVQQSRSGLTSSERQLNDLSPVAPQTGRVEDVMYRAGESVAANAPIVSIIPDGEVKVRFYVPQGAVHAFQPGRRVAIACDGCPDGMSAVVDFVATRPEFTPPIIYSLDARQKLVFLVEAVPANPRALIPGQPMDVAGEATDLSRR
ncbi:HlyD family secretion protein [Brevundimonas sp. CEF1]|uniref:HlyD family secretion protein n=1 Tax=Brevundimonas sp. CEF1 TaxID=3442642 RepID=UPI003F51A922